MDDADRKRIKDNMDKVIQYTDYKDLLNGCVEFNILSVLMKDNLENSTNDTRKKHENLLLKITQRGPHAYERLVELCKQQNYQEVLKILRPSGDDECISIHEKKKALKEQVSAMNIPPINNIINSNNTVNGKTENDGCLISKDLKEDDKNGNKYMLQEYTKEVKHNFEVRKSTKIHLHNKLPTYTMNSKNRGVLFLVNNIEIKYEKPRKGADIDGSALIHLFRELGFKIFYYENLTHKRFFVLLEELLQSHYTRVTECFVLGILSHGTMRENTDIVSFSDGSVVEVPDILDKFRNNFCPNLVGKPKLFFFPFCRGETSDKGTYVKSTYRPGKETDHIQSVKLNHPTYSDMLICYATVPGYKTHREPDTGSWYIEVLYKIWAEYAHDTPVDELMTMVEGKTGEIRTTDGRLQTGSNIKYGFTKALYFNPGCYKE